MNVTAATPLRLLRTMLGADHALLFVQQRNGAVALLAADPPQLPSQPFDLPDPAGWPGAGPLFLTDTAAIQHSPVGWILAGAQGAVLAAASSDIVAPERMPADTVGIGTYLLWQTPTVPPAHVLERPGDVGRVLQEHLTAMQQLAEYTRAGSRLQVLLETLPHGVVLTDESAGTAMVNAAAAALLDVSPGILDAASIARAMEHLHERMSNAGEVRLDGQSLFARGNGTRINWVWEVVHPERRTLLVSTLPVRAPGHEGRLWSFHDVTALRSAEAEQIRLVRQLERERSRVTELFSHAPALIMLLRGPDHVIEFANDAVRDASGGRDLMGRRLFEDELVHLRGSALHQAHNDVFRTGEPWSANGIHLSSDEVNGQPPLYLNLRLQPIVDADGTVSGIFAHGMDVTTQVLAIEQLKQSQKLEAMGRLTGGVAHDFNNLLTVIGGNTELLLAELTPSSQAHADATEVREAVRRAADLTRQLLNFSRRQVLQRHVVEIDHVVAGVEKLLRRVIGADITLDSQLGAGGATVMVDPGQVEQILVNLAVNSRDAMPDGGRLSIRTSVQVSSPTDAQGVPRVHGPHVRLLVRDTGHGMDALTAAMATQAFFTTKPEGKGTGLGLATVHDIVTQSGGAVWLDSTPGVGTSVWVALPIAGGHVTARHTPVQRPAVPVGRTVLLVEDESGVRHITQRILEDAGYRVILAANGSEGLRGWEDAANASQRIDCVITDVVMPVMGGRAMVKSLRQQHPHVAVLFVSGYVEGGLTDDELAGRTAFLAKPFTSDALLHALSSLLAGS